MFGVSVFLLMIFSFFLYFVFSVVGSIVCSVVILNDSVLLESYEDSCISFFVRMGVKLRSFLIFFICLLFNLDEFFKLVMNF